MQNILQNKTTLSIILLSIAINYASDIIAVHGFNYTTNKSTNNTINKSTKIYFDGKRYTIDSAKETKVTETINDMQPSIGKKYLILALSSLSGGLLSGLIGGFFCNSTNSKHKNNAITCLSTTFGTLGFGGLGIYYLNYLEKNVHNYLNQEQNEYLSSMNNKK